MANTAIALLLVTLILTSVAFRAAEPFQARAGDPVPILKRNEFSEPTCVVKIHEDDSTRNLDVKCGPTSRAMNAQGIYQRSGNNMLDNGRFRKSSDGSPNVCSLLMSDDLIQDRKGPLCETGNQNIYDSIYQDLIESVGQNGAYCEIAFKEDADDDQLKDYMSFLSGKATDAVVSRRFS